MLAAFLLQMIMVFLLTHVAYEVFSIKKSQTILIFLDICAKI